jgi:hypothetical protein
MPTKLTIAQIEDMLDRDQAQLRAYLETAMEDEAYGSDPNHALGLARFVEQRIALLRRALDDRLACSKTNQQACTDREPEAAGQATGLPPTPALHFRL